MYRSLLTFTFLFCLSIKCLAQSAEQPIVVPENIKSFVLKGYDVLALSKGDLNRDAYGDVILVLSKKDERATSDVIDHPEKRPLLILLGKADRSYQLAFRNDNVVYCVDCGGQMGDPFTQVVIKNGNFSVEHFGGSSYRWTRIITFKYQPAVKNWFLFKDGGDLFRATEPEVSETKVKTTKNFGKVAFKNFDVYQEQ